MGPYLCWPAFTGLLYGNLDEALEFISKWEKKDLLNAYKDAPMKGLDTNLMGKDMIYWISNLLKIAEKGLEKRDFIEKAVQTKLNTWNI